MKVDALIRKRFEELQAETGQIWNAGKTGPHGTISPEVWQRWSTSVLSLLQSVFGVASAHYLNFRKAYDGFQYSGHYVDTATGIFQAARRDYESGYLFDLEATVSGEIFGDFVTLAKRSLSEGFKDVAAVLACAALEDCLKRYAAANELQVDGKSMQDIVGALKSKGLVSGAQKSLLDSMPKVRDFSMHAEWAKITPESVGGVIGFVENFLLTHFG